LPPTQSTITYLWKLVVRLSKKLAFSGVDDSNGTVGGCVSTINRHIADIARTEPNLLEYARTLCVDDTGFGFEDELQEYLRQ
jgi:hypothetical protein